MPTKEEIATLGTFVGAVGAAVTLLKTGVVSLTERSLANKSKRIADEIASCMERFHKLQEAKEFAGQSGIDGYRAHLSEELQKKLQLLSSLREIRLKAEIRRNSDATGIRKWLLLYKPEGIDGWLVHSLFYAAVLYVLAMFVGVVAILHQAITQRSADWWTALAFVVVFGSLVALLGFYLRRVSQRLKSVCNKVRKDEIKHPNGDLSLWSKAILAFKTNGSARVAKGFYYYLLLTCLGLPFVWRSDAFKSPSGTTANPTGLPLPVFVIEWIILWALAEVLRADVLARRALNKIA